MTATRFLLTVLLAEATGLAVLSWLARNRRSGPGLLGMGFFTGALTLALWAHLLLLARVPLTIFSFLAGPAILVASGRWSRLRTAVWKRPPWTAALIAASAAFLLYGAVSWPFIGADAENFYLFKAKSIVHHGTFWNPDFLDVDRMHPFVRRPLLLPCLYAVVRLAAGSFDPILLRVWMTLIHLGSLAAMYDALRSRTDRNAAALGTAVYAWMPALWHDAGGALTGYADAPLAMIFFLSLASETPLAVLLAAAAPLLKDDAVPFVLGFAVSRGLRPAILPAITATAWFIISSFLPLEANYMPLRFAHLHFEHLPLIARSILGEVLLLKHWGVFWVLAAAALLVRIRKLERVDVRWLAPAFIQLGSYLGVWLSFPPETVQFLVRMGKMRLLMHTVPIFLAWSIWRALPPAAASDEGRH